MRMPRVIVPLSVSLVVGVALSGLPAGASAQQLPGDEPAAQVQAGKPAIYDTAADAKVQIAAALTKAKRENQRVLVMFGGIDKRALSRDRTAIEGEVDRVWPVVEKGGYLPRADHSIPPNVSWDNYRHYRQYMAERAGISPPTLE